MSKLGRLSQKTWYQLVLDEAYASGEIQLIPDEVPGWPLFKAKGGKNTVGSGLIRILMKDGWLVVSRRDEVLGTVEALTPVSKEDYVNDLIARSPAADASTELRANLMSFSEEDLADVRRKVIPRP